MGHSTLLVLPSKDLSSGRPHRVGSGGHALTRPGRQGNQPQPQSHQQCCPRTTHAAAQEREARSAAAAAHVQRADGRAFSSQDLLLNESFSSFHQKQGIFNRMCHASALSRVAHAAAPMAHAASRSSPSAAAAAPPRPRLMPPAAPLPRGAAGSAPLPCAAHPAAPAAGAWHRPR